MLNMDGDLPKHLTIGKYVLEGNLPPVNDVFSHTRYGTPFAPHKWLSGVFFYLSYHYMGEKGIVILCGVLLAATFALIYSDVVKRSGVRLGTFLLRGCRTARLRRRGEDSGALPPRNRPQR